MDQTFIKDPLHQTESLIESHHLPQAFYYNSNYQLKMDDLVRTMLVKTRPIQKILKFQCISVIFATIFLSFGLSENYWLKCDIIVDLS